MPIVIYRGQKSFAEVFDFCGTLQVPVGKKTITIDNASVLRLTNKQYRKSLRAA